MKWIAHYGANNETEEFETFKEAKKWLEEAWQEDGSDEGYAEESVNGQDYIAQITHVSKYVEKGNKEKEGYVWNEEECVSINPDGDMWPVSESFDNYGEIILEKIKPEKA